MHRVPMPGPNSLTLSRRTGFYTLLCSGTLPEKLIGFSIRRAPLVVCVTLLVTLAFGWFALKVRINPDFTSLLPQDAAVNKLLKEYGGDAPPADLLLFRRHRPPNPAGDLFSPDSLSAFSLGVNRIGPFPGVQSTVSPFNLVSFGKEGGRLAIRPMSTGRPRLLRGGRGAAPRTACRRALREQHGGVLRRDHAHLLFPDEADGVLPRVHAEGGRGRLAPCARGASPRTSPGRSR